MASALTITPGSSGGHIPPSVDHTRVGISRSAPVAPSPTSATSPGAVIGRHVVLQKVGTGGMGVVYAAYDPELDRKVALKLLLPGAGGTTGSLRLLREAQAMARLSHANVVAIHDVGTIGEQVWLAMEFVQGRTLTSWLTTPHGWRDVLAVLRQAGAGLAAAHAAGLLHRDFKPDNVMVGDDGRVCVMDFGLARTPAGPRALDAKPRASSVGPSRSLATSVTRVGVIVGTPSYMAPEQFRNAELTAAADQFAFCVTLWCALYGERPFAGRTPQEILERILAGKPRPPAHGRAVPSWLRHACERGLAADPAQRWPSMEALLHRLDKGHTRAWVRKGLAIAGGLALLGIAVGSHRSFDRAKRMAACEAKGAEVEAVWSPERERALHHALVATGVSGAATTADKTMPWLDQRADEWRDARIEVCLDAEVHGRWDADTLDRSLWCLDERRMELESLVDELTAADAMVLPKAVTAAAELASMAPCRDARVLQALAPPPHEDRMVVRAVRADVVRAGNLERAGRYDKGLELARSALERAEDLGWRPLSAAAKLQLGKLLERTGAYAESETALENAYFEAADGVAPEVAFAAASRLVSVVGVRAARHADGRRWGRHAEVALASLPDGEGLHRARWLYDLAMLHRATGSYDEAKVLFEQAIALSEHALGPLHPDVAKGLGNLASVHQSTGAYAEAKALNGRALAIKQTALGPTHPDVAASLTNLGVIHQDTGDYEQAKALHERALAISEDALGPTHPDVARSLTNLGVIHFTTGSYDEAAALDERALAIWERALGPAHPTVAMSLNNLALVHQARDDDERAKALYERALAIQEEALGPEHPGLAKNLTNLGAIHQAAGDHEHAEALYARSLAITEQALGPEHIEVGPPLLGLAEVALARGRPAQARTLAQRALTVLERGGSADARLADARFVLAKALWDTPAEGGDDRARAVSLAEQTRDANRAAGKGHAKGLAEVEAWLAAHRNPGKP